MNQPTTHVPSDQQPVVGYETKDVNPYYVGLFGLGLLAVVALVLLFLGWMFRRMETAAERADPPQSPVADTQIPPAPRLQVEPEADLVQLRRDDEQTLSSYGWGDTPEQTFRIPIDRAMDILAQRGFPEPEDKLSVQPQEQTAVTSQGGASGEPQGQLQGLGQPQGQRPGQPPAESQKPQQPAQLKEPAR